MNLTLPLHPGKLLLRYCVLLMLFATLFAGTYEPEGNAPAPVIFNHTETARRGKFLACKDTILDRTPKYGLLF